MGPVDRGLLRGRRANLDASRLAMHARYNSSPGQCPDTSLEGRTHDAWGEGVQGGAGGLYVSFEAAQIGKSWRRARGFDLHSYTTSAVNCDIALDPMS